VVARISNERSDVRESADRAVMAGIGYGSNIPTNDADLRIWAQGKLDLYKYIFDHTNVCFSHP
jgi:hypothetical protein